MFTDHLLIEQLLVLSFRLSSALLQLVVNYRLKLLQVKRDQAINRNEDIVVKRKRNLRLVESFQIYSK